MVATAPRRWLRRLGIEVRNVVIAIVLGAVVLAALVGVVILLTNLAVR